MTSLLTQKFRLFGGSGEKFWWVKSGGEPPHSKLGDGGHAALERQKDQVGAAAYSELAEQVGDVKFHGALGDVELASDLFVGEIFEQGIQNFLFAAAEIGDRIGFESAPLTRQDRIDESGQHRARNPETTNSDQRQRADQLFACFHVGQQTLYTETQQRIAVGIAKLFADDDQASLRIPLQDVGQQRAGCGTGGVRVNDVNLRLRRFEISKIGSQGRFEVFRGDLELRLGEQTLELAQHQRVRREDADG